MLAIQCGLDSLAVEFPTAWGQSGASPILVPGTFVAASPDGPDGARHH